MEKVPRIVKFAKKLNIMSQFQKFWYFKVRNPKVRSGESGGFKWVFRRYNMDISTLSGNFKARWTADVHPYGYLLAGKGDENIQGFAERMYMIGKLLTTDQKFVADIDRAIKNYEKRLVKAEAEKEKDLDAETEEKIALEEVKQVQEYVEMDKKEKRKYERDVNGRFKKAVKESENLAK